MLDSHPGKGTSLLCVDLRSAFGVACLDVVMSEMSTGTRSKTLVVLVVFVCCSYFFFYLEFYDLPKATRPVSHY